MSLPTFGLDRTVIEALGWTLVHFLWQGCLIAAALGALDVLLAKSRASLRYVAGCVAFMLMLMAPVVTFRVLHQPDEARSAPLAQTARIDAGEPIATSSAANAGPELTRQPRLTPWTAPSRSRVFAGVLPWVVELWALGVVLLSLRLLGGWWLVRRMMRSPGTATLESLETTMQRLTHRLRISRPVRLCRSALVAVPTTVGWLRPMILLPASTLTGLTPEQIEAVLAHELAHIRRYDYLVNLVQSVVEMLLFYHPAVWWVSRRIREERELCCDDLAIGVAGDPVNYARALCELERLRGEAMDLALAASGGSLRARIARLLGVPGRPWEAATQGMAGVFGAAAVLVMFALFGLRESAGNHASTQVSFSPPAPVAPVVAGEPAAPPDVGEYPLPAGPPLPIEAELSATDVAPAMPAVPAIHPIPAMPPADETPGAAAPAVDIPEDPSAALRFSASEWERMRQHGVSERYVRRLEALLPGLTSDQIIDLANHGVSSVYVANLRKAGLDRISVEGLIHLASHGVSSAYVRGLGVDPDDLTIDELVRLASNGVASDWYSAMEWMGLSEFSVDRAIQLRNHGVTPDYANQMKLVTRRRLSLDELTMLRNQGVTADYAARMYGLFGLDLNVEHLVRMRNQGVTPEYAEQMRFASPGSLDIEDLIQLRNQGVEPGYAYQMWRVAPLEPRDLIRLRQNGVDADFIEEARKAGHQDLSVSRLIRLRQQGLRTKD